MTTARDMKPAFIFAERRTRHPVFHRIGQYIPLEDPYAPDASGKARQLSRCGRLLAHNPFGYNGTRTMNYALMLRRDHAEAFATACRKCYRP